MYLVRCMTYFFFGSQVGKMRLPLSKELIAPRSIMPSVLVFIQPVQMRGLHSLTDNLMHNKTELKLPQSTGIFLSFVACSYAYPILSRFLSLNGLAINVRPTGSPVAL